jgi:hypothetical protein
MIGANGQRPKANDCLKNKCGPGQPPGPHCLADILLPISTHEAWGEFSLHLHSEEFG